jgi:hypothetical protein
MKKLIFMLIGFAMLVGLGATTYSPSITYLEESKTPFRVKPANVWTQDIPNSEHEDKCIFNNYVCAEQYKSAFEDLGSDCCLEELIAES